MNARAMLHMKHLVEEDIRRHIQRNRRHIENAANKDRIVGRIVTPENVAGFRRRPGQAWLNQRCVEVLPVQPFKQKFKVDVPAARSFSIASSIATRSVSFFGLNFSRTGIVSSVNFSRSSNESRTSSLLL